jgi:hypothetical protein
LVLAAKQLGLTEVPAIRLTDLTEPELRALRLGLNRITEDANWDRGELTIELSEILKLAPDIELEVTGFEVGEIDNILQGDGPQREDDREEVPPIAAGYVPVTRPGDVWLLGQHRLSCGDPSMAQSYERLLCTEEVNMMFADLASGMPIDDHVSGLERLKKGGSATAPAEPFPESLPFLTDVFTHAARCSIHGAFHFVCTQWPHANGVMLAAEDIYGKPADVCIWISNRDRRSARTGLHYLSRQAFIFGLGLAGARK